MDESCTSDSRCLMIAFRALDMTSIDVRVVEQMDSVNPPLRMQDINSVRITFMYHTHTGVERGDFLLALGELN